MRKKLLLSIGLASFMGTSLFATMVGSLHDLSTNDYGDNDEICVYCHTPHGSNIEFDAPLWNKPTTGTSFTMYGATAEGVAGKTIAGTETDPSPSGASLACLSCHDGVSAANTVINAPGSDNYNDNGALIGRNTPKVLRTDPSLAIGLYGDLTNDHPISIPYVEGAASLKPKDTAITGWNRATTINDLLRNGKVQCVSCHDPHSVTNNTFLRHRNTGSELCKTCHDK